MPATLPKVQKNASEYPCAKVSDIKSFPNGPSDKKL